MGGLLFCLVWFERGSVSLFDSRLVIGTGAACLVLGGSVLVNPSLAPEMVLSGKFTRAASFLNEVGGGLLVLASLRLGLTYRRGKKLDDGLFALHCLLFGLAATMFSQSSLWDFAWWSWHGLRFFAYLTALWFLFRSQVELETRMVNEVVEQHVRPVHERLAYTLEAAGVGVWEWTASTGGLTWDPQMYKLYGLEESKTELDSELWVSLLHPEDRDEVMSEYGRAVAEVSMFDLTFRIVQPSGDVRVLRSRARFLQNDSGDVTSAQGVNFDLTDETEARAEIAKLYDALNLRNVALDSIASVAETDPEGRMTYEPEDHRTIGLQRGGAPRTNISTPELGLPRKGILSRLVGNDQCGGDLARRDFEPA